jgi:hypothetical protein
LLRFARNDDDSAQPGAHKKKNARSAARLCQSKKSIQKRKRRCYAACLCMAPEADADPRIALIERSIAPHSLVISAAARPSA